jgi:DNA repair exonuclease SbcCD ATPase subunit
MDLLEVSGKDFCLFEEFSVALHEAGLVWIGGENKDTEAADSNGSGKSTIFKALTWCLFGETIDGEKGDKVIRRGTKRAHVETKLRDKHGIWKVIRERKKGTPTLELIQPDGEPFKAAKGDLQSEITKMIGLDFKAFKNTVLYGQNDSARFASLATKDNDRKDMLHRILRTDMLKECHAWILEQGRKAKGEIALHETEIAKLDARMGEHSIADIQADFDAFEAERSEAIDEHTTEAQQLRQRAKDESKPIPIPEDGSEVSSYATQIKKLEAKAKEAEKAGAEAKNVTSQWNALKSDAHKVENEQSKTEAALEANQNQLKRLSGDRCPVCTSPLGKGDAAKHKHGLEAEATQHQITLDEAEAKLETLQEKLDAFQARADALAEKAAEQPRILREIGRLKDAIAEAEREKAAAEAERKAAAERVKRYIELAKKELEVVQAWEAKINPHDERLKTAKAKVAEFKKAKRDNEAKRDAKATDLAHIEFWSKGFGNQGLPSFILDSVMPYLTERANEYLKTLADGDIKLNFSTQRELKSAKGEVRDEIEITWEIEGTDDSYPPSGGQLKKMEIATDLALMDLVATREGGHPDILMMDEVLDGLDAEGRQRVLQLLHELRSKRGSIFVISHESEIAEIFEKAITVVKSGGSSKLEMAA